MSRRQTALQELVDRLETITTANGYNTDAGSLLFIGEAPVLGPDDEAEALALVVRDDAATFQGENALVRLPVEVQATVRVSEDFSAQESRRAWTTVEAIVEDIKKAVETDHNLGGTLIPRGLERGSTSPKARESGSTFVGATVEYVLLFTEAWGNP